MKKFLILIISLLALVTALFVNASSANASTSATPSNAYPRCYEWVRGTGTLLDLPAPYTATQVCYANVDDLNFGLAVGGFTKIATGWDTEHSPTPWSVDFVTKNVAGCDATNGHYYAITNFGSSGFNNALDAIQAPNGSNSCLGMTIYGGINYGGDYVEYPAGYQSLYEPPPLIGDYHNWTTSLVIGTG